MNTDDRQLRLKMVNISKTYGAVTALRHASFEVRPGEVMALLGENGAGKSTLVKMLSGLVEPDTGEISIDGQVVDLRSSARSQQAGVAVVQQEYSTVPSMSVAENLVLGQSTAPSLRSRRWLMANARRLLAEVGLEDLDPRTRIEDLDVARSQLVEIARVLSRESNILIFDEPTAALFDKEIERLLSLIRKLAAAGRSIIYVTHRLAEVFEVADRVTIFRNGESLPPQETKGLDVDSVVTLMIGRRIENMYPNRREIEQMPILLVENLRIEGLNEPVSFSVNRGEIVGLTGQLGSGANFVLQAIAGIRSTTGGSVLVNGAAIPLRGRAAGLKRGVAYCSADRKRDGFIGSLSIQKNLSAPWIAKTAKLGWMSSRKEKALATEVARQFGIDQKRIAAPAAILSGGNQQKVTLGKWLGAQPKILLVEEPTRGVDVGARAEIYQRLADLCSQGLAIIVASSDTLETLGLCDRVAAFYRGRMTAIRACDGWTAESLVRHVTDHAEVQT
jgi:ribose transport system ATP-binding protein